MKPKIAFFDPLADVRLGADRLDCGLQMLTQTLMAERFLISRFITANLPHFTKEKRVDERLGDGWVVCRFFCFLGHSLPKTNTALGR
jgi:hypothetical protein